MEGSFLWFELRSVGTETEERQAESISRIAPEFGSELWLTPSG
jgi:hypothetical protein